MSTESKKKPIKHRGWHILVGAILYAISWLFLAYVVLFYMMWMQDKADSIGFKNFFDLTFVPLIIASLGANFCSRYAVFSLERGVHSYCRYLKYFPPSLFAALFFLLTVLLTWTYASLFAFIYAFLTAIATIAVEYFILAMVREIKGKSQGPPKKYRDKDALPLP